MDPGGDPQFVLRSMDRQWVAVTLVDAAAVAGVRELVSAYEPGSDLGAALRRWLEDRSVSEGIERLRQVLNGSDILAEGGNAVTHGQKGELYKGFPFQSRKSPMRVFRPAPKIGEDTEELLTKSFGFPENEVRALINDKIIFSSCS